MNQSKHEYAIIQGRIVGGHVAAMGDAMLCIIPSVTFITDEGARIQIPPNSTYPTYAEAKDRLSYQTDKPPVRLVVSTSTSSFAK